MKHLQSFLILEAFIKNLYRDRWLMFLITPDMITPVSMKFVNLVQMNPILQPVGSLHYLPLGRSGTEYLSDRNSGVGGVGGFRGGEGALGALFFSKFNVRLANDCLRLDWASVALTWKTKCTPLILRWCCYVQIWYLHLTALYIKN